MCIRDRFYYLFLLVACLTKVVDLAFRSVLFCMICLIQCLGGFWEGVAEHVETSTYRGYYGNGVTKEQALQKLENERESDKCMVQAIQCICGTMLIMGYYAIAVFGQLMVYLYVGAFVMLTMGIMEIHVCVVLCVRELEYKRILVAELERIVAEKRAESVGSPAESEEEMVSPAESEEEMV
eukprot:TRINITY_DN5572_c0_g1_i1.p1 TRINITY_DN5572_c0_g1~~TRINITY_DN5572_c0_g1_i1.p1  ORF type:complete len:181 (-),score=29.52 TRINITY_DN5572_c0_g1_i1:161-703(-)